MKQLVVSVLLLLVATLVFSQAENDSQEKSAVNKTILEQQVQPENSLAHLYK